MYYSVFLRLLNGHGASGEIDTSLHLHHAAEFLEGSAGSSIQGSGLEDDRQLSKVSPMAGGSGGFKDYAKRGKSVTKHDDASQTDDTEFGPSQIPPENVRGVWRGEVRGQFTEVDSTAVGRGEGGHARGAGAERRSGNRGRTRGGSRENRGHGVEDVGYEFPDPAKPSNTDVRPKQPSAFKHVTDVTQVRNSFFINPTLLGKLYTGFTDSGPAARSCDKTPHLVFPVLFTCLRFSQGRERRPDWKSHRGEFHAWLHKENQKLAEITNNQRALSTKELKIRRSALKVVN